MLEELKSEVGEKVIEYLGEYGYMKREDLIGIVEEVLEPVWKELYQAGEDAERELEFDWMMGGEEGE